MSKFVRHISHDVGLTRGSHSERPEHAGALTIGANHGGDSG
ncbi:hypothetical protein [Burkholderia sp. L27(2015)]|nr:hypothetical protein [Burkholderia sp. L27(2015)]